MNTLKCHNCGKFCIPVEWKMLYSSVILTPDDEIYRCKKCIVKIGSFKPQNKIVPNFSCGTIKQVNNNGNVE